jgi:hypothetical protein
MCQFSISFSGDPETLIQRVRQEIERARGTFSGDSTQGNFGVKTGLGSIEGNYQIAGQAISITITDKPFFISCERIEKELTGYMR